MKRSDILKFLFRVVDGFILALAACCVYLPFKPVLIPVLILAFLLINVFPSPANFKIKPFRLRMCADGSDLLASFVIASALSLAVHIFLAFSAFPQHTYQFIVSCIVAVILLAISFWNGIIRVFLTSVQLGIQHRVIAVLCGWIPVANIISLFFIIRITQREVQFEYQKILIDENRKDNKICHTKYPILFVHGVFFRDFKYLNYWGRIPKELETNGAVIYYGNHQSALSVADSGAELAQRIKEIVQSTGCGKLNIIAHSKGGLDCRYAISKLDCAKYIASLTTINTPHRGCFFADSLLEKAPETLKQDIASTYNTALKKLGDANPDFLAAIYDLTKEKCTLFNQSVPDSPDVFYQSVGSKLNRAANGKFPLNFSYPIVKHYDGVNDGLVSEGSFEWGEHYAFLTTDGKRGISHGDMIDLNRENIPGFDVREFYVNLVADLKNKGF